MRASASTTAESADPDPMMPPTSTRPPVTRPTPPVGTMSSAPRLRFASWRGVSRRDATSFNAVGSSSNFARAPIAHTRVCRSRCVISGWLTLLRAIVASGSATTPASGA